MTRQLKGLLYLQAANGKHNFTIFWSILLTTTLVSIAIAALTMPNGDVNMTFSYSAAIYIYAMFVGFNSAKVYVRYALHLGATRKNIFVSTAVYFLGLAFISALFLSITQQVITFITSVFHIDGFELIHPAQLLSDTWLNRLIIDTSLMFFMLTALFLFGLFFYRYGLIGGGSLGAVLAILLLVGLGTDWLQETVLDIIETISIGFFGEVLLAGIIIYLVNWLLLRRITILTKG